MLSGQRNKPHWQLNSKVMPHSNPSETTMSPLATPQPYTKSLEDELDWQLLDQLYGVVSQISNFCFETKKFCVTTEFVVLTLLAKFTTDKLDRSLFVTALAIPICFWFLDSVAYFYQVSIRGTMDGIRERIKVRSQSQLITTSGTQVIASDRVNKPRKCRIFDAAVNHSMWLYGFLIVADVIVWRLYAVGVIK